MSGFPIHRLPILLCGFVGLGLGVAAGLLLMGWPIKFLPPTLVVNHGALMICGLFGVLISLERAVALGKAWAYSAPIAAAAGTAALLVSSQKASASDLRAAISLYLLAGCLLSAASWRIYRKQPAFYSFTLVLGALFWALGSSLWLSGAEPGVIRMAWLLFLILTIAGERLELSRLLAPPPRVQRQFGLVLALLVSAIPLSLFVAPVGAMVFWSGILLLSFWLARHDIARHTIRTCGLTRYIAACLLSGYFWLAMAGLLGLSGAGMGQGSVGSDAAMHAITLGFVFGMVFGHMPIILPSLLKTRIRYSPLLYLPLILLQTSLLLRITGDLAHWHELRSIGGLFNAVTIGVFILCTLFIASTRTGAAKSSGSSPPQVPTKS